MIASESGDIREPTAQELVWSTVTISELQHVVKIRVLAPHTQDTRPAEQRLQGSSSSQVSGHDALSEVGIECGTSLHFL